MIVLGHVSGNIVSEFVMKNVTRELILYTFLGLILMGLYSLKKYRFWDSFIPGAYLILIASISFYIVAIKEKYIWKFQMITFLLLLWSLLLLPIVINLILNPDHWLNKQLL